MSKQHRQSKTLPGVTLTEVLIVMIVSGVMLLVVMDGLGLFRRHSMDIAGRITDNSSFYEGYYRLENLVTRADSLSRDGSGVVVWRGGEAASSVTLRDSLLVAISGHLVDTLLTGVAELRISRGPDDNRADSLVVVIPTGERSLSVAFATNPPVHISASQTLADREKEYEYE